MEIRFSDVYSLDRDYLYPERVILSSLGFFFPWAIVGPASNFIVYLNDIGAKPLARRKADRNVFYHRVIELLIYSVIAHIWGINDGCRAEGPAREPPRPALAGPDTGCPLKMSYYFHTLNSNNYVDLNI